MAEFFESLGKIAEPIGGALDFLAPTPEVGRGGPSLGSLMGSVGRGAKTVVSEGPGAVLGGITAAFDPNSGMSARDRLLVGGLSSFGGVMLGREAHRAWKSSLTDDMVRRAMPSGHRIPGEEELINLGDPDRFAGRRTPMGSLTMQRYPGTNPRQAEILGAEGNEAIASAIGRWAPDDEIAPLHAANLFDQYSRRVGDARGAQVDWAKFDLARDRGVFAGAQNARYRSLWTKLTTEPQSLTPSEAEELFDVVERVGRATDAAAPDLSVGVVGRIERIDVRPGEEPLVYVRQPSGWTMGSANDADVRTERLKQLNYRALAERGRYMLRTLYELGMQDWERIQQGLDPRLWKKLEVGPRWYPVARDDVARAFNLPLEDSDELQRAVAAVSFLSEAEDWATNIPKARRVLEDSHVRPHLEDEEFLDWLRDRKVYEANFGKEAAQAHEKTLKDIHEYFKKSGVQSVEDAIAVVMRLMGGKEELVDIFRSTDRRKQKNFFLNIYYPELEFPVTIDRHAFDAFLGMDSGVKKRPIDLTMGDGDQVYDVVADTYRSLAAEYGVNPHQLQAVIWEVWRMVKEDSYTNVDGKRVARRGGWNYNDPYMLPEADGSVNQVWAALNGIGIHQDLEAPSRIPGEVLELADGLTSIGLGDGSVVQLADLTDESLSKFRHLYPSIKGEDGLPRWAPLKALPVRDVAEVRAQLGTGGDYGESLLNSDLEALGGHPLTLSGDWVVFDLEDGVKIPKGRGIQVVEMGRITADEPELSLERYSIDDIDPDTFEDPNQSLLLQSQWVAISAFTGTDADVNRVASNKLLAELKRRGYRPVEVDGRYKMDDGTISYEKSYLAFGMPPEEGLELGRKYGQESVLVPQGLIYGDGTFRPQDGIEFGIDPDLPNRSMIQIGKRRVTFAYDFDWTADPIPFTPESVYNRTTRSRRRFGVRVKPTSGRDVTSIAEELESKGGIATAIYTNRQAIEGWQRGVEHLYDDGVQTYTVRTKSGAATSPNSGYFFTRSLDGIPDEPPAIRPAVDVTEGDLAVLPDGTIVPLDGEPPAGAVAVVKGSTIESLDDSDVIPLAHARGVLQAAGRDVTQARVGGKKFSFVNEPKRVRTDTILLANGRVAPYPRSDLRMPDWEEDFGFEFDPGYRVGNKVHRLDDRTVAALRSVTEDFESRFGDAMRRFRLQGVTVSPGIGQATKGVAPYGFLQWEPGGIIVLSKEWWSDLPAMMESLAEDRASGHLARGAAPTPESILVHEYGHVVHGALRLSEGWGQKSRFDRELAQLVKDFGGRGSWQKHAKEHISDTAGLEISELIAESFSEVMTGTPSALSRLVVDFTEEQLREALTYRKMVGW